MSFNNFFTEAATTKVRPARKPKLDGYGVPPSRAKFQAGDIVVVQATVEAGNQKELERYFRVYHPKLAMPYVNSAGIVRLYKAGYMGQMGTKYAVEFEDGNIIPISSSFLIGPFKSMESANKYKGKHDIKAVAIDSEDLAGFEPDSKVEVDERMENNFKKAFVNDEVGFKWLDKSVIIKFKNFDVYILAFKKADSFSPSEADQRYGYPLNFVNYHEDYNRVDNPDRPEFRDGFVFCKVIDKLTKRLQKTQSISSGGYGSGTYFLQRPEWTNFIDESNFVNGKVKDATQLLSVHMGPVGSALKNENKLKKLFSLFDNAKSLFKTGYDCFKHMYDIKDGEYHIKAEGKETVKISQRMLGNDFKEIQNYTIEGSVSLVYKEDVRTIFGLPKAIKGEELYIGGKEFASLEGMDQCDVSGVEHINISAELDTVEHFPESLNVPSKIVNFNQKVKSLRGIPDVLKCFLTITQVLSYSGASNCVNKGEVRVHVSTQDLNGFFKDKGKFTCWSLDDEKIRQYENMRALEDEFPEIAGTFS